MSENQPDRPQTTVAGYHGEVLDRYGEDFITVDQAGFVYVKFLIGPGEVSITLTPDQATELGRHLRNCT